MADNSSSNIKKGTVITYITQFLGIGISFFYVPIMLGILGQDEYGLYALVQSIVAYFQMSDMGIGITATRYNAKYMADDDLEGQRNINGMFLVLYSIIAAVCGLGGFILYQYLPQIYDHYSAESISLIQNLFILAMINLVLTLVFKIYNAIIIAYERFVFAKTIQLIQTVLGPIGMLAVLYMGYRSVGMVVVTTALTALFGFVQLAYCHQVLDVKFHFNKFDKVLFGTIMSFTLFVFLNSLSHQLFSNSDKIIVSILLTEASIAVYAIVIQFQTYFYNFANVLSGFYLPRFTKMVKGTRTMTSEVMDEVVRVGRVQVIIAGLIFGGFAALGHPFVIRWVGPDYELAYHLTILLLFCEFVASAQSMFNALMQAMNLHRLRAVIGFIAALLKIAITIGLVYLWGLWGCGIAYVVSFMIRLFAYNLYYRHVGIAVIHFWKEIVKVLLPISICIVILYGLFASIQLLKNLESYLLLLVFGLLYVTLFFAILWKMCFSEYERTLFKSVANKLLTLVKHGK
ncbi:MAG: lipopolysaccharide biosynthesis protein [Bacteroides sp.]|nr:lipopolysaccharide biosynthesis protein [Bacteroides sp.]MCM1447846.1 lipopolysaccharide biosynthesis protein [Bacteroides sp.]